MVPDLGRRTGGAGGQGARPPARHAPVVGWERAPDDTDARHPGRDRPARAGRHHGRHPELQERRDDRVRGPGGPRGAGPVLPRAEAGPRQLRRRQPRRHPARRRRDRAAGLRRVDPPRPADQPSRPGHAHLPRDRRRRRQGRGPADDLRDRRGARGPGPGRRRQRPAQHRARMDRAARGPDPQGRLRLRRPPLRSLQVRRDDHQHRHLPAHARALRPPDPPADRRRLRRQRRPRPALPRPGRLDRRHQQVRHRHLDDDIGADRRIRRVPGEAGREGPRPEGPGLGPGADVPPGRGHDPAARGEPLRRLAHSVVAATTSRRTASSGSSTRRRSR